MKNKLQTFFSITDKIQFEYMIITEKYRISPLCNLRLFLRKKLQEYFVLIAFNYQMRGIPYNIGQI